MPAACAIPDATLADPVGQITLLLTPIV